MGDATSGHDSEHGRRVAGDAGATGDAFGRYETLAEKADAAWQRYCQADAKDCKRLFVEWQKAQYSAILAKREAAAQRFGRGQGVG